MKTNDHLLKYNNLIIVRFYARPSTQKKKKKNIEICILYGFCFCYKTLRKKYYQYCALLIIFFSKQTFPTFPLWRLCAPGFLFQARHYFRLDFISIKHPFIKHN